MIRTSYTTVLLTYNSHTINFLLSQGTVQWFSVQHRVVKCTSHPKVRTFRHPQRNAMSISRNHRFPSPSQLLATTKPPLSVSMDLSVLAISCKWKYILYGLLWPASFTYCNVFKFHPRLQACISNSSLQLNNISQQKYTIFLTVRSMIHFELALATI